MAHNWKVDGWETEDQLAELVKAGDVLECPQCLALSAYASQDTNIPGDPDYDSEYSAVYHIGAASGLGEWQCGKCKTYLVDSDSVLLAECFTHTPSE